MNYKCHQISIRNELTFKVKIDILNVVRMLGLMASEILAMLLFKSSSSALRTLQTPLQSSSLFHLSLASLRVVTLATLYSMLLLWTETLDPAAQ